jgi:meiotically up-regulated gene 157 (Mug157) protein
MSQIMYALTSDSGTEIQAMIQVLKRSAAVTGFIHESYNRNDATLFSRAWFAWANTLFGELIARTATRSPALLG